MPEETLPDPPSAWDAMDFALPLWRRLDAAQVRGALVPGARERHRELASTRKVWRIGAMAAVASVVFLLDACGGSSSGSTSGQRSARTTSAAISHASVPTPVTSATARTAASAIPDLFVHTAAMPFPGELFVWPGFPAMIEMDDNDWISGLKWSASPERAVGSGTFYTDLSCNEAAASCPPAAEGTVEFQATLPETCTVTFADPSSGAQHSEEALVYDHLRYTEVSGAHAGQVVTFSSPCSGASRPPQRCRTSMLTAQAFALAGGGAAGSQGGAFGFTNQGTVTCTLFGYPGMQLLGANGQPLPTTVIRGQYEVVDVVPERLVTLTPGAEARFYYMYSDVLGGGSPAVCPRASAVEITPPGAYSHLVVATDIAPCEGHIWVSPVTTSTPYPLVHGSP